MLKELFESCFEIESSSMCDDAFVGLPAGKGVILFAGADETPIQLLMTGHIRRAVKTRLIQDNQCQSTKRTDISHIAKRVYSHSFTNDFSSKLFYNRAGHVIFPTSYGDWITVPRQTFVYVDYIDKCPCFLTTNRLEITDSRKTFCLFPTRKTANQFAEILNSVFRLCRNPSISCTENAATCPYLQMNTCDGFCIGKIARQEYLSRIDQAIQAIGNGVRPTVKQFEQTMNTFASHMEFEKAMQYKERIRRLKTLAGNHYHWTTELKELCILHIDKGDKIPVTGQRKRVQTYDIFVIGYQTILKASSVRLDSKQQTQAILRQILTGHYPNTKSIKVTHLSEHLGTLSWFLFRDKSHSFSHPVEPFEIPEYIDYCKEPQ